jgi:hypothetical protein
MWDNDISKTFIYWNSLKARWCVSGGSSDDRQKFVSTHGSTNFYSKDVSPELMCSAKMTASSFSNYWYHADWENVKKPPIKCDCVEYNGIPANCGQNYNHKGEATPWCYVSENCPKFYAISRENNKTPWDFCPSSKSKSANKYPQIQLYAAE